MEFILGGVLRFDDDEEVFEALRAGAVGYLLKDAPSEKLVEAIRAAARGESFPSDYDQRHTVNDQTIKERVLRFHRGATPPVVKHFVAPQ